MDLDGGRSRPAGHRLRRSAARLRPRAGPLRRRQRRPRGLRVRLRDRRDRRQHVRLSGSARAFRRGGGLLLLLGVGPKAVERGEATLGAYPAVDLILGQAADHAAAAAVCWSRPSETFPPELQSRPAALSGRRRSACSHRAAYVVGRTSGPEEAPERGARVRPRRCSHCATPTPGGHPSSVGGCGS